MAVSSILIAFPIITAIIYKEYKDIISFLIPAAIFLVLGSLMSIKKPSGTYKASEGFVITALSWLMISAIGALPFVISGQIPSYIDAFFETVSGFTTTGASIVTDYDILSKSILFWRSFTHWVGGMGVLALGIAILPVAKGRNKEIGSEAHILRAESPGPTFGKMVAKLRFNSRILYGIYLFLTVFEIVLLLFGGMSVYDSIVYTFATAGTGGFAVTAAGVGLYNSVYLEMVVSVFMILFGINFNVYYFMLIGKFKSAFKHEEMRWYLAIIAVSVAVITANTYSIYQNVGTAFRYSFFQVSSIITTTGFATADFNMWPTLSKVILVLLMFIGACAGSTGGGIKVSRLLVLVKTSIREVRHSINPRAVHSIRCDGEVVEHTVITNISAYFAVYMLLIAISTLLVSFDGYDITTSFTSVAACMNNIGPGLGLVGPMGNYAMYSVFSKIVLSIDMLLGRLEIFPLLIVISPCAWKNRG